MKTHRELHVWNKAMDLALEVYALARVLPKEEQHRLTAQLIKAAISVPANIAEGYKRGTRKDYANFISIARGSCAEVKTFLLLAEGAGLAHPDRLSRALVLADEVSRMLTRLRVRLMQP